MRITKDTLIGDILKMDMGMARKMCIRDSLYPLG